MVETFSNCCMLTVLASGDMEAPEKEYLISASGYQRTDADTAHNILFIRPAILIVLFQDLSFCDKACRISRIQKQTCLILLRRSI